MGYRMRETVQLTEQHNRRETWVWGGWNLADDDDTPAPPEPDSLASAQSRRAWKQISGNTKPEAPTVTPAG